MTPWSVRNADTVVESSGVIDLTAANKAAGALRRGYLQSPAL